jgi:hypothetical protein
MDIVYYRLISDSRQRSVSSIEERIGTRVILRSEPFSFHYFPKGFRNVQMRGIWRNIEEEETSLFPDGAHFPNSGIFVRTDIVKDNKSLFA